MGCNPRENPARLAEKLVHIRKVMGLSQDSLIKKLGLAHQLTREEISKY